MLARSLRLLLALLGCYTFCLQLTMSQQLTMKEAHVDVLIIGAGPAGLMCANALVQAGLNVRIVDKR